MGLERESRRHMLVVNVTLEYARLMADFEPRLIAETLEGVFPSELEKLLDGPEDLEKWLMDLAGHHLGDDDEDFRRRVIRSIYRDPSLAVEVVQDDDFPVCVRFFARQRLRKLLRVQ